MNSYVSVLFRSRMAILRKVLLQKFQTGLAPFVLNQKIEFKVELTVHQVCLPSQHSSSSCLSVYLSVFMSLCLSVFLSLFLPFLSSYPPTLLSSYPLFSYPPTLLSSYPPILLSSYPPILFSFYFYKLQFFYPVIFLYDSVLNYTEFFIMMTE